MIRIEDLIAVIGEQRVELTRPTYSPKDWSMQDMQRAFILLGKERDSRFKLDSENIKAYCTLIFWLMNDSRGTCINPLTNKEIPLRLNKGIYLAGNTGTGKTLAMQILSKVYNQTPFKKKETRLLWNEERADRICERYLENGDLSLWKRTPFLCIQDLGSEPLEMVYMGNRVQPLRSVIESRGDNSDCITMVTSNIPLNHPDMVARYGERAVSRLVEMCNYVVLTGRDRRMAI